MWKKTLLITAATIVFGAPVWAQSPTNDAASFLSKASQINYEEQETAKMARSKAGDNQALLTYAEIIRGDHKANEEAVSALSRQKNIKLESPGYHKGEKNTLSNLKGAAFDQAYLEEQVTGHQEALETFKTAENTYKSDPDVELYIQQTIPMLEAHLKMAENLKSHLSTASTENPANNKSETRGMGQTSSSR